MVGWWWYAAEEGNCKSVEDDAEEGKGRGRKGQAGQQSGEVDARI